MAERETTGGGTATDLSFMSRLLTATKYVVKGAGPLAWFGPSQPMAPTAPEEVKGRAFDYPVGFNLNIQPRSGEAVNFQTMRALADNYDLLRIVIETVKDQIATQDWTFKPRDLKAKPDNRCDELKAFFAFPDKEHDHGTWLRMLLEDMLVIDAPAIFPRMTKGGQIYALETVDGATIKRVLNADGRTPIPPDPAYQQVLKGLPAVDYTRDELVYFPRNMRSNRVYGYSPVEQIIMTVNIALRRQLHQLEFYTEGNVPDLLFRVPETWQPEQIKQMQAWWDFLVTDTASRRKAKFIPGGVDPYDTKTAALKDEYDEWLARVVCFCFSISPQPFIKEVNRATAQTSKEASKEEGKGPRMLWIKRLHDFLIWKYWGYTDLEFSWEDQTAVDALVQAQIDQIYLAGYVVSPAEIRSRIGLEGEAPEKPAPPTFAQADGKPEGKPEEKPLPVEKLDSADVARAKKKRLKPIDRERGEIVKQRNAAEKAISDFFAKSAKEITRQIIILMDVAERAEKDEVDGILEKLNLEALGWSKLADSLQPAFEEAHIEGWKAAFKQIDLTPSDDITKLLNIRSAAYAEARSAELVGMKWVDGELVNNPNAKWAITETTREKLRSTVSSAINEGLSSKTLAKEIESSAAFDKSRAEMIARTEIAFADVDGNMAAYRDSGIISGKEWILGSEHDDDDECAENAAAGPIGFDDVFPSGDDAAPAHPN